MSGLSRGRRAPTAPTSSYARAVVALEGPRVRQWDFPWHPASAAQRFHEHRDQLTGDAWIEGKLEPPPGTRTPAAVLFDIGLTVIHPSGEHMLADARAESPAFEAAPHHLVAALLLAAEARHLALPLGLDGAGRVAITWGMLVGLPSDTALRVWQRMMARDDLYCELDPDAVELFEELRRRGIKVGAVSNSDGTLQAELRHFGLDRHFDAIIDSTAVSVQKPAPAIFHAAFNALGVAARDCWFVGDGLVNDVLGSQAAGIGLAVLYDRFGAYLHLPDVARVSNLAHLRTWLDETTRAGNPDKSIESDTAAPLRHTLHGSTDSRFRSTDQGGSCAAS